MIYMSNLINEQNVEDCADLMMTYNDKNNNNNKNNKNNNNKKKSTITSNV